MNEPNQSQPQPSAPTPNALTQAPQARVGYQRSLHAIVFWAPVWLPMIVLAQISMLGLGPALAKRRALAASEQELAQRLEREQNEQAQLQRWQHAQSDPIYLERERRLLRTGEQPQTSK